MWFSRAVTLDSRDAFLYSYLVPDLFLSGFHQDSVRVHD